MGRNSDVRSTPALDARKEKHGECWARSNAIRVLPCLSGAILLRLKLFWGKCALSWRCISLCKVYTGQRSLPPLILYFGF